MVNFSGTTEESDDAIWFFESTMDLGRRFCRIHFRTVISIKCRSVTDDTSCDGMNEHRHSGVQPSLGGYNLKEHWDGPLVSKGI